MHRQRDETSDYDGYELLAPPHLIDQSAPIEALPKDLWINLLHYLSIYDYNRLVRSSRQLAETLDHTDVWYLFSIRYFPTLLTDDIVDRNRLKQRFRTSLTLTQHGVEKPNYGTWCCESQSVQSALPVLCCVGGMSGGGFVLSKTLMPNPCNTQPCVFLGVSAGMGIGLSALCSLGLHFGVKACQRRVHDHYTNLYGYVDNSGSELYTRDPNYFREGYHVLIRIGTIQYNQIQYAWLRPGPGSEQLKQLALNLENTHLNPQTRDRHHFDRKNLCLFRHRNEWYVSRTNPYTRQEISTNCHKIVSNVLTDDAPLDFHSMKYLIESLLEMTNDQGMLTKLTDEVAQCTLQLAPGRLVME